MHGLVDSSDPGMESAETEEVALSEKQVCVGFGAPGVGCFWKELQVEAEMRPFYEWDHLIPTLVVAISDLGGLIVRLPLSPVTDAGWNARKIPFSA